MERTASEADFEAFCDTHHLRWERIPTESAAGLRTPDYYIYTGGQRIVVEVKELTQNEEEKKQSALLQSRGWSEHGGTVGSRMRSLIDRAKGQIRILAKGGYASILLVCNYSGIHQHTEPHFIRAAMYGFDTVLLSVPKDPNTSVGVIDRN